MMYTKELIEDIYGLKYEHFDENTINNAKRIILDTLGVAFAGSKTKTGTIWLNYFKDLNRTGNCSILGTPLKYDVESAASLIAAWAHALDFDDVHTKSIVHPAAVTIPLALALKEDLNKSMNETIEAIIIGFEMACRIGESINPSSYWFWHTTALVGSLSNCIVACKMLGLSKKETLNSIGNAGSQASGLWDFLKEGAMTKTVHVARAASNGLFAATAASYGLTGSSTILEGDRGLIKAVADDYDLKKLIFSKDNLKINEDSIKAYPCCRHTHSGIYAILKIRNKINIDEIISIEDNVYHTCYELTNNPNPNTSYACKFSLQYCLAIALLDGGVNIESFSDESFKRQEIKDIMEKIKIIDNKNVNKIHLSDTRKWIHNIKITTKSDTIEIMEEYPYGDYLNPMSTEDLLNKFNSLTYSMELKEKDRILNALGF